MPSSRLGRSLEDDFHVLRRYDAIVPFTRVKICGVTRPEDALCAAIAGADAVGMVLYPKARRHVTIEQARLIVNALPAFVTPVALFVDQEIDEVRRLADSIDISHLQLHGHETPMMVAGLRDYRVLKAIRADRETLASELRFWRKVMETMDLRHLCGLVLETPVTGAAGGTGIENDWDAIAQLQLDGAFEGLPPIIVAGGLRPDNVAAVVRRIRPYAVDVSSGVEEQYGLKSPEKIAAFISSARLPAP